MKLWTTMAAAIFAVMMAMPSVVAADIGNVHPQTPQPAVTQTALAPQPLTTLAYYHRPWACGNRYFRRHHWWLCR